MSKPPSRVEGRHRARRARLAACAGALALLCACSAPGPSAPRPAQTHDDADEVSRVLAYHQRIQSLNTAELARERRAAAEAPGATRQMQQALLALHPRSVNLARARSHLDAIVSGDDIEARKLQPLARVMLEHVSERARLEAVNDRFALQLEQANQKMADTQALAATLQQKLDALAEIERHLSERPAAPLPSTSDRSGPR